MFQRTNCGHLRQWMIPRFKTQAVSPLLSSEGHGFSRAERSPHKIGALAPEVLGDISFEHSSEPPRLLYPERSRGMPGGELHPGSTLLTLLPWAEIHNLDVTAELFFDFPEEILLFFAEAVVLSLDFSKEKSVVGIEDQQVRWLHIPSAA